MNIFSVLSSVPVTLTIYFGTTFLVFGGLVWYALYRGGYVRAVFSHGKTVFELEAKERHARPEIDAIVRRSRSRRVKKLPNCRDDGSNFVKGKRSEESEHYDSAHDLKIAELETDE
jgi:hypothetical protein